MLVGILVAVLVVISGRQPGDLETAGRGLRSEGRGRGRRAPAVVLRRSDVPGHHHRGPLVRLDLIDSGIRLRGTFLSRWIVPTSEARYDELAMPSWSRRPSADRRLVPAPWLQAGIGFLCETSGDVLQVLEEHGVPVRPVHDPDGESATLPRRLTGRSVLVAQAGSPAAHAPGHPSRSLTRAIVPTGSGPSGLMFSTVTPASA